MDVDRKEFPIELDDCFVSNLMVMHSGAGYYLGRVCIDKNEGFQEPYSRETDYMTLAQAEAALVSGEYEERDCPENDLAYLNGLPNKDRKPSSEFAQKVEKERERFKQLAKSVGLD